MTPGASMRMPVAPVLVALLALGSAACEAPGERDAGETAAGSAAPEQRKADEIAAAEAASEHSDARAAESPGKPTAPISISHDWLQAPAVGRDLALELEIGSARALCGIRIAVTGGDGLVVDAASAVTRVASLAAGETHTFEPRVLAADAGTHYLDVSVTAVVDGAEQTRSISIPVRLGSAADTGDDAVRDARPGERVRSLPAEERPNRN